MCITMPNNVGLFKKAVPGSKLTYLQGESVWDPQLAGILACRLGIPFSLTCNNQLILFGDVSMEQVGAISLPEEMTLPPFKLIPITVKKNHDS